MTRTSSFDKSEAIHAASWASVSHLNRRETDDLDGLEPASAETPACRIKSLRLSRRSSTRGCFRYCSRPSTRRSFRHHGVARSGSITCFELVYGVVKHHGSPDVSAPPGLDFHQFANPVFAEQALANAGFADVACDVVDCAWGLDAPDGLVDIFAKCTVRAAMLLASQPVEAAAYRSRPGDRMAGGRRTSRR